MSKKVAAVALLGVVLGLVGAFAPLRAEEQQCDFMKKGTLSFWWDGENWQAQCNGDIRDCCRLS